MLMNIFRFSIFFLSQISVIYTKCPKSLSAVFNLNDLKGINATDLCNYLEVYLNFFLKVLWFLNHKLKNF